MQKRLLSKICKKYINTEWSDSLAEGSGVIRWTDAGVSCKRSHTRASVLTAMLLAHVRLQLAVLPSVSGSAMAHVFPQQVPANPMDAGLLDTLVDVLLAAFTRPSWTTFTREEVEEIRAGAVVLAGIRETR